MREVFEAFLTDPIRINEDIYTIWLEGHNANDALAIRLRNSTEMTSIVSDESKIRELLWRDTVDQYRLFEKLEHYLMQPSLFRSQLLFQIPPIQQHYMVERYYTLDGTVGRWLIGKKPTAKLQKDLDEISEQSQQTIKSCRRQLENLRRIYSAMEDRNFQGILCQYVSEWFLISEKLASRYACVLFLLHARFEVHPTHKITAFLTWHDLLFFASVLMCHWCPQRQVQEQLKRASSKMTANSNNTISDLTPMMDSFVTTPLPVPAPVPVLTPMTSNETLLGTSTSSNNSAGINYGFVDNGAEIGLRVDGEWPSIGFLQEKLQPMSVRATIGADLSHKMTNSLRDLKAHLINDNETLANYRHEIMQRLGQFYEKKELEELQVKLYLIVHGFLTIGAGLSQPKELKDLLENLIVMVIRVLKDCEMKQHQLNQVFSALIDSLAQLDVWYLHVDETRSYILASWERFISVCRIIILSMYDRL